MGKHMDIGGSHPDVYVGFRLYLLVVKEGTDKTWKLNPKP